MRNPLASWLIFEKRYSPWSRFCDLHVREGGDQSMRAKIVCGVLGAVAALGGVVVYLTEAVVPGFVLIGGGVLVTLIPSLMGSRDQDVAQYNEKHKVASML